MEYTGLTFKFKLNRPLTEQEKRDHLPQKKPTAGEPFSQSTIIKMNSTYLECVDKFFGYKGFVAFAGLVGGALPVALFSSFLMIALERWGSLEGENDVLTLSIILAMCLPVLALCLFALYQECFRHTHYPIRFNRKNKKVYVFRTNGTIFTADWEKLYFSLGMGSSKIDDFWDVRGHVLGEDGETVKDTFALPHIDCKDEATRNESLTSFFEFVRRYMEGTDKDLEYLYGRVGNLANVSTRRENPYEGLTHLSRKFAGGRVIGLIFFPLAVLFAIPRWLAMLTSRIPKWSAEIEAECAISPNDPYVCDEDHPPP